MNSAQKSATKQQRIGVSRVMSKFPANIAQTFTHAQQISISKVFNEHFHKKHTIDLRGTIPVPFLPSRIYYVLLLGRDVRALSRQEITIALATLLLMVVLFLTFSLTLGVLLLYILKSALGINIFEDFSVGIWSWLTGA